MPRYPNLQVLSCPGIPQRLMAHLPLLTCQPWVNTTSGEVICIKYSHLCGCLRIDTPVPSRLARGQ